MGEKELKFPSPDPQFSGSTVLRLCDPGRVPRPCPGPLGFQEKEEVELGGLRVLIALSH